MDVPNFILKVLLSTIVIGIPFGLVSVEVLNEESLIFIIAAQSS
jgi:hypothetical protein